VLHVFLLIFSFFKYDWKKEIWNLLFVAGIFLGGLLTMYFLANPNPIEINPNLKSELANYGITDFTQLVPADIFSWQALFTLRGFIMIVCRVDLWLALALVMQEDVQVGHAIMGLSTLQWPSLIATCCFMIGGFIMANLILPLFYHFNGLIKKKKKLCNKIETNTDFEVRSLDAMCVNESQIEHKWYHKIKYLVVGIAFGIIFIKAEIISWFRIQEMFKLQSFSYVRSYRKCSAGGNHLCLAYQKI
jgi:uncharacterized membrane protein YedE/YeeE